MQSMLQAFISFDTDFNKYVDITVYNPNDNDFVQKFQELIDP